ncbi:MAG: hypothetical protein ACOY4K_17345 [Pseudomonadota bacterium]
MEVLIGVGLLAVVAIAVVLMVRLRSAQARGELGGDATAAILAASMMTDGGSSSCGGGSCD